jgi:triacylglycerol lipase
MLEWGSIPRAFSIMVSVILGLFPNTLMTAAEFETPGNREECVVLLHGLGRTSSSMGKLEKFLFGKGYRTVNFRYPSTRESIEQIAAMHIPKAIAKCREGPATKIHFVTHSLGGIVARQYLQANTLPKGSRLVMLAPPNQGSEVADYLKRFFAYRWLMGPAGEQMGTGPESVPNTLDPINVEVGIITGDKSFNPLFSSLIPGPDDGRVSIERARLEEMTDFLVIPSSHTFIMRNPDVIWQVAHFLEHGGFDHSQTQARIRR